MDLTRSKLHKTLLLVAVILALAGCGASRTSTDASGATHWSDSDAQTFMATCNKAGIGGNYDCECLMNAMQAEGRSPGDNPGELPSDDLSGCKN